MDDLVRRLSENQHPVEFSSRPARTVAALKSCLDRGYVHIKFPNTRGGTELGVRVDRDATDLTKANFEDSTGQVEIVGTLTLNYVDVRCKARIDLQTLNGEGRLEIV